MGVRVKMEVSDQVSEELRKLGAQSAELLSKVLFSASMGAKKYARKSMRSVLNERSAFRDPHRAANKHMLNEINFKGSPKTARNPKSFRLKGPRLGSVYEYNGADIFPRNKPEPNRYNNPKGLPILRWRDENGNWRSSNFVHIDARPFFYPSMRDYLASGEYDRNLQEAIDRYLDKEVKL